MYREIRNFALLPKYPNFQLELQCSNPSRGTNAFLLLIKNRVTEIDCSAKSANRHCHSVKRTTSHSRCSDRSKLRERKKEVRLYASHILQFGYSALELDQIFISLYKQHEAQQHDDEEGRAIGWDSHFLEGTF